MQEFKVGDKVMDMSTREEGEVVEVQYNEDIEGFLYITDFSDFIEIYTDAELTKVVA